MTTSSPLTFSTGTVRANGLAFSYLEQGEGPLVLALHGFPDLPYTFCHQLAALAAAGYRVVAPWLRGYPPSGAAPDGRYEAAVLVQDVLALAAALSPEPVFLLGHDWGAQAAYGAAILTPERVAGLIAIAVPPGLGGQFITNPLQQRRSWYLFLFQLAFAEAAVAYDDFAFLDRLWREWSPGWDYPAGEMARLKETFRIPGVLPAALDYYRQTLNPARQGPELAAIRQRLHEPVPVPALYLHGADDGCIGAETVRGVESRFAGGVAIRIVAGAGHFVHREQPVAVNRAILEFLAARRTGA